jgi:hypothetical protein
LIAGNVLILASGGRRRLASMTGVLVANPMKGSGLDQGRFGLGSQRLVAGEAEDEIQMRVALAHGHQFGIGKVPIAAQHDMGLGPVPADQVQHSPDDGRVLTPRRALARA